MDSGHRETDKLLEEIERRVTTEYSQAAKDMQKKLDDYLKAFQQKDEAKQKLVSDGVMSWAEYDKWRVGQIMIGERWKEMRDSLAEDLHNSNMIARSIVNGYMPDVYALNHNYATFEIEKGSMLNTSYTLYDRQTVERLISGGDILKENIGVTTEKALQEEFLRTGKDLHWQQGKIQSVTLQAILQGESIPNMSKRIAQTMGELNKAATVRYARTATTAAENAGRTDSYKRAEAMGIKMSQMWLATHDGRTRHSHAMMDREIRAVGELFSNGCEYPGDPSGPDEEVWNCRCSLRAVVDGLTPMAHALQSNDSLGDMSYSQWEKQESAPENAEADFYDATQNAKEFTRYEHEDMNFDEFRWDDLSPAERDGVYNYTDEYYESMNRLCRGQKVKGWDDEDFILEQVQNCTSALNQFQIKEDTMLYRGMGSFRRVAEQFGVSETDLINMVKDSSIVGMPFTELGFCSTAIAKRDAWEKDVMLNICAPKGTKGLYVDPISANRGERELLLQRGTMFEVYGANRDEFSGRITLDVVVIGQNPAKM